MHLGIFSVYWKDESNTLYGIGQNTYGQLCTDDVTMTNTPQVIPLNNVSVVDAGRYHVVFLQDGKVYGCGQADKGQLGAASSASKVTTPILISGDLGEIIDIGVANKGTILLNSAGQLFATGINTNGELGLPKTVTST